jgi:hypothetical protein
LIRSCASKHLSMNVHRVYIGYIGLTNLYFVIITDIYLRVRMSSAILLALRHWISLRYLINNEFFLEDNWISLRRCLRFVAWMTFFLICCSCCERRWQQCGLKIVCVEAFDFWRATISVETMCLLGRVVAQLKHFRQRLCIFCAAVYVRIINPVDRDIFDSIMPVFLATRVFTWEHCNSSDACSPVGAVCSFVLLLLPLECNTCLLSNVTV